MELVDLRQDASYGVYMRLLKWGVDGKPGSYSYTRKFSFLGSIAKIQRPGVNIPGEKLNRLIDKRKVRVVYVEPSTEKQSRYYVEHLGFKKIKSPSIPSKTVHVDLRKSQSTLLKAMHHKTRYNIGLAKRRGVEISEWKSVEGFSKFWHKLRGSKMLFLSLHKNIVATHGAFGKKCKILRAEYENETVGAVLLVWTKTTGYYYYAAASDLGKKHFTPSLLVWEAMLVCKKNGCRVFDFEGIYDDRYPLPSWKGFSRFKKSFGGVEVEYPGPLRKVYLPYVSTIAI